MAFFANDTVLGEALAEIAALYRRRRFWAVLGGVVAILALTGPFDTYGALPLGPRTLYWSVVGVGSFTLGLLTSLIVAGGAERLGLSEIPALLLGGGTAGFAVAVFSGLTDSIAFGGAPGPEIAEALPYAVAIALVVAVLYEGSGVAAWRPAPPADDVPPDLFGKLPPEIGTDIVHLQAQDHYVRVTTTGGAAMVLMSIGAAAQDLGPGRGMRVHRSWWVGHAHVRGLERRDGRLFISTTQGEDIPVGRAYRSEVRAALGHSRAAPTAR